MPFVKLGVKFDDDSPEDAIPSPESESKVHYPTLYIDVPEGEDLGDLPEEGEVTIKYRITRDSVEKVKRAGKDTKKTRSIAMDVLAIGDYSKDAETGDNLDKLRDETGE